MSKQCLHLSTINYKFPTLSPTQLGLFFHSLLGWLCVWECLNQPDFSDYRSGCFLVLDSNLIKVQFIYC